MAKRKDVNELAVSIVRRLTSQDEEAIALHFIHYNFCRIHATLRVTAAMEAGVSDRLWSIEDLVGLLNLNGTK